MGKYNVLVVDDSIFMRKLISDIIEDDDDFHVVGTAKNGREAVSLVRSLKPHVVTLDIEMPEMNGLEALEIIMKECPTPVIMLSSLTKEGAKETIRALELGAADFIQKPSGPISLDLYKVKNKIIDKLHISIAANVSKLKTTAQQHGKDYAHDMIELAPASKKIRNSMGSSQHIVAIGTSTGGPKALKEVITSLPQSFPAPILIVQHMPPHFTKSLAERLDSLSNIHVVEAEDGCRIEAGTAYISPGGYHMKLTKHNAHYYIVLTEEELRSGHRPSVDVLFESLVPFKDINRHAVIMTGMGSDGAKGMLALLQAGAVTTIAESNQTCVIYGMPRSAIEQKSVMHVLPLQEIPIKLVEVTQIH